MCGGARPSGEPEPGPGITPLPSLATRTQINTSNTTTAAAEMGQAGLKTCCLYAALLLLSSVILLTSFTIQWILYSIQFSLVRGVPGWARQAGWIKFFCLSK